MGKYECRFGQKLTNVGRYACHDDLLLAGGLNGGTEIGIVPGIDFALALDEGRVGVHFQDLFGEGPVRSWRNSEH